MLVLIKNCFGEREALSNNQFLLNYPLPCMTMSHVPAEGGEKVGCSFLLSVLCSWGKWKGLFKIINRGPIPSISQISCLHIAPSFCQPESWAGI